MLVVSRKLNETIEIRPDGASGRATLAQVFGQSGITISLVRVGSSRVSLAIDAPPELKIRRSEAGVAERTDGDRPTND